MKLYELFAKIAKGEVKEGTRIIQESPRCKREYTYKLGKLRLNTFDFIEAAFTADELNDEVEMIEPAKDINVSTNGEIEEVDLYMDNGRGTGYMFSESEQIIIKKQNEVIKAVNKLNRNEDAKRYSL